MRHLIKQVCRLNDFAALRLSQFYAELRAYLIAVGYSIYVRTESSQYILLFSDQLNWFMGHLGRVSCTIHSISAQASQEGIKCTKAEQQLRAYCPNIYTLLCYKGLGNARLLAKLATSNRGTLIDLQYAILQNRGVGMTFFQASPHIVFSSLQ